MQSKASATSNNAAAAVGDSLFVKGFLRSQWLHSDLHRAFEGYGKILSAKVSLDRYHKTKGFGYI